MLLNNSDVRRFVKDLLHSKLQENNWNVTKTAKQLNLHRNSVYNYIKYFGLDGNTVPKIKYRDNIEL